MDFLRTPDEHFANLPDFPYEPHYLDLMGGRMHYLDVGAGETILCLHGEPSWSFLYRHIIAGLQDNYRLVAPDMFGFGRSDKPTKIEDHTYTFHYDALVGFIEALDLQNITLVCQDWGGILGLPIAANHSERFARLVIMNTGLPDGHINMGEGFMQWRNFAERVGRDLISGTLIRRSSHQPISDEVVAAYDAPFPDASYRAGVAAMPLIVPINTEQEGAAVIHAAKETLKSWQKPALVMFSDKDPVTASGDRFFRKLIPTASEQPEITINDAGHFLQEEKGAEIAQHIHEFMQRTTA